jgi:MFS family permease
MACGISAGAEQLVISRFVQGISAAIMAPQVLSMIQILFTVHHERTKAMGWYGITIGIGTILGQFLGGYFSSLTIMEEPWRLIFLMNIPICLPAVFLSLKLLNESKTSVKQSFDMGGVAMLSAGLFCATYALTMSEHEGFHFKNAALMVISAGIIFGFIKNQKRRIQNKRSYLIDFELFRYKNFNLGILAVSFFFIMLDYFVDFFSGWIKDQSVSSWRNYCLSGTGIHTGVRGFCKTDFEIWEKSPDCRAELYYCYSYSSVVFIQNTDWFSHFLPVVVFAWAGSRLNHSFAGQYCTIGNV